MAGAGVTVKRASAPSQVTGDVTTGCCVSACTDMTSTALGHAEAWRPTRVKTTSNEGGSAGAAENSEHRQHARLPDVQFT